MFSIVDWQWLVLWVWLTLINWTFGSANTNEWFLVQSSSKGMAIGNHWSCHTSFCRWNCRIWHCVSFYMVRRWNPQPQASCQYRQKENKGLCWVGVSEELLWDKRNSSTKEKRWSLVWKGWNQKWNLVGPFFGTWTQNLIKVPSKNKYVMYCILFSI